MAISEPNYLQEIQDEEVTSGINLPGYACFAWRQIFREEYAKARTTAFRNVTREEALAELRVGGFDLYLEVLGRDLLECEAIVNECIDRAIAKFNELEDAGALDETMYGDDTRYFELPGLFPSERWIEIFRQQFADLSSSAVKYGFRAYDLGDIEVRKVGLCLIFDDQLTEDTWTQVESAMKSTDAQFARESS